MEIRALTPAEQKYTYAQSMQLEGQTANIGHLRGDFDSSGYGFYTTWTDTRTQWKTDEFKAEFDEVINALRSDKYGLLKSRSDMSAYARQYADSAFKGSYCTEYGFRVDTEKHAYLLRCNPTRGDYNFYCYCFVKEWLDKHIQKAEQGIRFIDPNYKELFRIPDGGRIIVTNAWGEKREYSCRFIKEDIRKEYSRSLLELSIEKSTLGIPMAFAEGNPKERIKNVMKSNTKKIIGFAGLGAVILIVVIAICLIPNRPQYATAKQTITEINAIATPSATHAEIKTADGNKTITDSAYFNELLTFVEGIEINTKEVKRGSWIDSEENNKITFYRADNSMDSIISFTSDYSKIWIETNATLSFTYSVKDPAEVQKGLAAFLGSNS